MKARVLFSLLLAGHLTFIMAQQPVIQQSDGGVPWSYKYTQFDKEISYETMPAVDNVALLLEDELYKNEKNKRFRFGFDHFVSYNIENNGVWRQLDSKDYIWRLGISSPGAISLSFSFKSVILPEGCRLFVMNKSKTEYHGAFNDSYVSDDMRIFSTEVLYGDEAIIELFVPEDLRNQVKLELWRVTHAYIDLNDIARAFGGSDVCENNVRCPEYVAYDDQIRSVVCLVDGGEFCTGTLINNTCNDGTPYVLTANHCYTNPSSWTFRFNWEASDCTNPVSSPSTAQSIAGGTLRAGSGASDFCLVEINSAVPSGYNPFWAGWNRNVTAPADVYCIHHPNGDIKKFSLTVPGLSTMASVDLGSGTASTWQTTTWTDGVTEPGSSGAPLFNSSGQVVGQLYGGPSNCGCENNVGCGYDYFGRFDISWTGGGTSATRLSDWLDPVGCTTGATTDNGYDPNAASLAWDAQITGVITPTGNYCDGNIIPVIILKNNGTNTITSIDIAYQIDGGASINFPWSGSLTMGNSVSINMPSISVSAASHTYTATASTTINGSQTDLATGNNAQMSNFIVINGTGTDLPFSEGFEGGTFPPTNWTNENPNNNVGSALWVKNIAASGFGNSTACSQIDQFTPSSSTSSQVDNLITPYLNLTTQNIPLNLSFSVANARYSGTLYDSLVVWVSTNCGSSWIRLTSYGNNSGVNALATAPDNAVGIFVPTALEWATKIISLDTYALESSVQIKFQAVSGWGNNTYIDDVNISGLTSIQNQFQDMLMIYPNPASQFITIDNSLYSGGQYQLYISNMLGEVLISTNSNTQKTLINLTDLANGSYLLKVVQGNQHAVKKMVVIK